MLMMQESSDPDLHLQILHDHGIYTIEEINELSRTVKAQYSAIHLNSRSSKHHFEKMYNLLDSISCNFDFMVVPRHGLLLKLIVPVFKFQVTPDDNRTFSTGGGVALYVSLGYSFAIKNDLKIDSIENLWIKTNGMIVGVIYKPPNFSNTEFQDKFERILQIVFLSLSLSKKNVF